MRKGENSTPAINPYLFKEYEHYIRDIFSNDEKNVEVHGPPRASKDPRPEKKSCLETTVRNKIKKMSYVHFYFNSQGITKYQRNVTYGWEDLIAFFGGIVGLCVGFSLLSGAEFIYYFTLRFLIDIKKEKDKKMSERRMRKNLKANNLKEFWKENSKIPEK